MYIVNTPQQSLSAHRTRSPRKSGLVEGESQVFPLYHRRWSDFSPIDQLKKYLQGQLEKKSAPIFLLHVVIELY